MRQWKSVWSVESVGNVVIRGLVEKFPLVGWKLGSVLVVCWPQ